MKLVVGLGNPGLEYESTRHNAGFRIVERLAERHAIALARDRRRRGRYGVGRVAGVEAALLAPETWMNHSGRSVLAALALQPLDPKHDLLVAYDDLDLPFGRLRIRPGGGAGGHRGLADVQTELARDDFPRLRFGIGRPSPGEDPVAYVLAPFAPPELASLPGHLDRAVDAIELLLAEGVERAMNRFNAGPTGEGAE